MTQNQLDIPQISFERYFDLLKRRKWQVLPVSVLGLLVGAIVASMVPQYYVAMSVVHYEGRATDDLVARDKDPMKRLVSRAKWSIPNAVAETLQELGWPEAHGEAGAAFREQVESRVSVRDEKGDQGRQFADLKITYKDTDIERAVSFTNTLVEIWKTNELDALESKVRREVEEARREQDAAGRTVHNARKELQTHEETHGLNPTNFNGERDTVMPELTREKKELESEVRKLRATLAKKRLEHELKLDLLNSISPTIKGSEDNQARKQLRALLLPVQQKAAALAVKLGDITDKHKAYASTKQAMEAAGKDLKRLLAEMAEIATEDRPNPEYRELQNETHKLAAEIEGAAEELKLREADAQRLKLIVKERPKVVEEYRAMREKLREAIANKDYYRNEWQKREKVDQLVRTGQTIKVSRKAKIPRTPTETSGTLIALAGSLVGLGLAIGLILLLDMLRTTFKTVDDVERGLTVPVLGAMAYLQTAEERVALSKTRRRVSVACGAFVFLSVSLVTVYYVAPWRLPDIVHQALHMLLGAPR